jgi:putative two-component system response regulator
VFGDRILEPIHSLQNVRKWVYQHHERIDGKGYPEGLSGDEISLQGRILIVAEVFDALVSERSYKPSWPIDQVRQFFLDNAGSHFDPQIVQIFLAILDQEGIDFYENPRVV